MSKAAVIFGLALAVAACGSEPPVDRPINFGGDRPVQLQVPAAFDDGVDYPLVMILHGYSAGGFVQQAYLGLGNLADAEGMLVLAPDGTVDSIDNPFWNADPACCDFDRTGVDDVAYLGGLIDDVMAAWPVDPARVTLLGHSNGSFMAYRMACDRADVVTSIAGLAGLGPTAPCSPAQPVHVLHIHGTADGTVPYDGNNGVGSPGAVATVAAFAERNGCQGGPTAAASKDLVASIPGAETAVEVTGGCPGAGAADLWTMEGGGHLPSLTSSFVPELLAWIAAHPRP